MFWGMFMIQFSPAFYGAFGLVRYLLHTERNKMLFSIFSVYLMLFLFKFNVRVEGELLRRIVSVHSDFSAATLS